MKKCLVNYLVVENKVSGVHAFDTLEDIRRYMLSILRQGATPIGSNMEGENKYEAIIEYSIGELNTILHGSLTAWEISKILYDGWSVTINYDDPQYNCVLRHSVHNLYRV